MAIVVVILFTICAFVADTVVAMRSEHRLSRSLVTADELPYDPEVTISGFPFIGHARTGDFAGATITARGVPVDCPPPGGCHAELGATLGSFSVPDGFRIQPRDVMHTSSVHAYTRLDSVNLGRMLEIPDLTVNTPAPEGKAGGGGPGDGLLSRESGVLLTGTVALGPVPNDTDLPPSASRYPGPKVRVSVSADLSVVDGRLRIVATDFYRGPEEHSDAQVADELRADVLSRFDVTLPALPMPWDITGSTAHSEGSDILIEGESGASDLRPVDF
ncbi:DUF2993 domain-containing protein [Gordonia sp. CPCC 206044]